MPGVCESRCRSRALDLKAAAAFERGRLRSGPFPSVQPEQAYPRHFNPSTQIGQRAPADHVNPRARAARQASQKPPSVIVEPRALRVAGDGRQRAVKIQEQQPAFRRLQPFRDLWPRGEEVASTLSALPLWCGHN